jgi:hypothetical protein
MTFCASTVTKTTAHVSLCLLLGTAVFGDVVAAYLCSEWRYAFSLVLDNDVDG